MLIADLKNILKREFLEEGAVGLYFGLSRRKAGGWK